MAEGLWKKSRGVVERVVVTGDLVLETPAHFGTGERDGLTDLTLLTDTLDGSALLPGTSIAGALRNDLREREKGYGVPEGQASLTPLLFGAIREDPEGEQSPLIVDDVRGKRPQIELRDGVKIESRTRTAEEKKKFDVELLPAGTTFPLRIELLVSEGNRDRLLTALALTLGSLERGDIHLGARKRRGYGRCQVPQWEVQRYNLTTTDGLVAWLAADHPGWANAVPTHRGTVIATLLGVQAALASQPDRREWFTLHATFALDGSLLIRSGFGEDDRGPDMVHLHSPRPGRAKPVPILSGTSLAGALRQRALRITRTLAVDEQKAIALIDRMFGPEQITQESRNVRASRVVVEESVITGTDSLVQNRIRIDRFTGGAYETALFSEEPVFGGPNSRVTMHITLRRPDDAEIGLLLLILKDLWTGDLPLGGESGVGRGRLHGIEAGLEHRTQVGRTRWTIRQQRNGLAVDGDRARLEAFVTALRRHLGGEGTP